MRHYLEHILKDVLFTLIKYLCEQINRCLFVCLNCFMELVSCTSSIQLAYDK